MRLPRVQFTIGQVMTLVVLVALDLTVVAATPQQVVIYPFLWLYLGLIDFLVLWKLILRRPLRASHYTCLIVSFVASVVLANLLAAGRLRLLSPLVLWLQHRAEGITGVPPRPLLVGEFWVACLGSLTLGCTLGWAAARLERLRGWDIAAFFRGALLGLVVSCVVMSVVGAVWGWEISRARLIGGRVFLGVCLIVGGLMGLSKLKSKTLSPPVWTP